MTDDIDDRAEGGGPDPSDGGEQPPPANRWAGFMEDLSGVNVDWRTAVLVPVLAIVTALLAGGFIILVSDPEVWRDFGNIGDTFGQILDAYIALFQGSFGSLRAISETLTATAPLILAGLSVAIGFRAGLFNIGAEGQILIGGMAGAYVGFTLDLPIIIHLPLVLIAGMIGGAVWGGIAGLLRARTGAHEVITTIMLNNIAAPLTLYLLTTSYFQVADRTDPVSDTVANSAKLPRLLGFLDRTDLRVHAGIIVALLAAYGIYWLLQKSTIGFEFRAVGSNPDAARYAGMKVGTLYVAVMGVAGAMAGLAGTMQINGVLFRATPGFSAGIGFEAISLALLGRSNPAGVVAAGLLFGALRAGGQEMQAATDIPIDLILVIQALVVVFIAAPALIRAIYRVRTGEGAGQLTKGWAT
jgi:simple sugar transport system permease protein